MRVKRLLIGVAFTMGVALPFLIFGGSPRLNACESIRSGSALEEIILVLGEPVSSSEYKGDLIVSFKPDAAASGNIRAIVDPMSRKVKALLCRYRQPATWEVKEEILTTE